MTGPDWKSDPRHPQVQTVAQVVGANVQRLRRRRGWTQDELRSHLEGLGMGISRPTMVSLEKGKRSIGVAELFALGLCLGVAPHLLLYPRAGVTVALTDDPKAPRYPGEVIVDWLFDPDDHEFSTAGVYEGAEWFERAGMGHRVSTEDLRELSRRVRSKEQGAGTTE